jgi:hypothetical protein
MVMPYESSKNELILPLYSQIYSQIEFSNKIKSMNKESPYIFNPTQLAQARIQLHYAIQPLAATASALCKMTEDSSHLALYWDENLGFKTQVITSIQSCRIVLDPITLTLEIVGDSNGRDSRRDRVISVFALGDRTLSEAFDWIKAVIKGLGGAAELITPISYPPDDFPDSELAREAKFDLQIPTVNLAEYYSSANQILQEIIKAEPRVSPVRIWPHHFDFATLISLPDRADGESLTIGIGLSPGDLSYDEPYWYVTPYPYPENLTNLPALDGNGTWHTSHWVGAVLTASQFGEPTSSIEQVQSFLNSAIAACKYLLTPKG